MHTLIHVSDTHILPTDDERLQGVDTYSNLERVFAQIADSGVKPDAVIVSGDIANGGEPESYRRAKRVSRVDALPPRLAQPHCRQMRHAPRFHRSFRFPPAYLTSPTWPRARCRP